MQCAISQLDGDGTSDQQKKDIYDSHLWLWTMFWFSLGLHFQWHFCLQLMANRNAKKYQEPLRRHAVASGMCLLSSGFIFQHNNDTELQWYHLIWLGAAANMWPLALTCSLRRMFWRMRKQCAYWKDGKILNHFFLLFRVTVLNRISAVKVFTTIIQFWN